MSEFGEIFSHALTTAVFMWGSIAMIGILATVAVAASRRPEPSQPGPGIRMHPATPAARV